MPENVARASGVAAVALLWSTLGIASFASGFPLLGPRPLSWLAADRSVAWLYAVGLGGGAALLLVFHRYVRNRFPVGHGFTAAMVGGMVGQAIAAVVPIHGGGARHTVHTVAALTLGASLPALMWRFAAAQPPGTWRRRCRRLAWAETAACVAGVALSRRSVAPLAEILPAACFHAWIIAVTARSRALGQTGAHGDAQAERRGRGALPVARTG
jgi:hypothetical protein